MPTSLAVSWGVPDAAGLASEGARRLPAPDGGRRRPTLLSAETVRPYLLHGDPHVRTAAVEYFADRPVSGSAARVADPEGSPALRLRGRRPRSRARSSLPSARARSPRGPATARARPRSRLRLPPEPDHHPGTGRAAAEERARSSRTIACSKSCAPTFDIASSSPAGQESDSGASSGPTRSAPRTPSARHVDGSDHHYSDALVEALARHPIPEQRDVRIRRSRLSSSSSRIAPRTPGA